MIRASYPGHRGASGVSAGSGAHSHGSGSERVGEDDVAAVGAFHRDGFALLERPVLSPRWLAHFDSTHREVGRDPLGPRTECGALCGAHRGS
jgi:hypothetical protein